jgi:hypothetical protein
MGGSIYYASPNGLCAISGSGVTILSEPFFTSDQWMDTFNPSTIRAFLHQGRYIATYDNGSEDAGFIYDPRGETAAFTTTNETFDCHYRDPQQDVTYIKQGTALGSWENSAIADTTYTWRSKIFHNKKRVAFSVVKLQKDTGSCTVNVYGDGTLIKTKDCTSIDLFRLPSGDAYIDWEIEIIGTARVDYVTMADTMVEVM